MSRFICPSTLDEDKVDEVNVKQRLSRESNDRIHQRLFNHTIDEIYLYRYIPACIVGEKMMDDLFILECDRVELSNREINVLLPILKANLDNINYYLSQLVSQQQCGGSDGGSGSADAVSADAVSVSTLRRRSGLEYLLDTFRFKLSKDQLAKLNAYDDVLVRFKNKCINYYKLKFHMDKIRRYIKPSDRIPHSHFWWISPELVTSVKPTKKIVSFVSYEPTEVRYYAR